MRSGIKDRLYLDDILQNIRHADEVWLLDCNIAVVIEKTSSGALGDVRQLEETLRLLRQDPLRELVGNPRRVVAVLWFQRRVFRQATQYLNYLQRRYGRCGVLFKRFRGESEEELLENVLRMVMSGNRAALH